MSVCILYDNLGPYHIARIQALSRLIPNLFVIELTGRSAIYGWQTVNTTKQWRQVTLFPDHTTAGGSASAIRDALYPILADESPRLIITAGYLESVMRLALQWGRQHETKNVLMIESWKGDKRRFWIKEKFKSVLVQRWFDAVIAGGWRHVQYARSLGFSAQQIWRGVDVVDNDHFAAGATKSRRQAETLRRQLRLPENYFICVARYSPEKNLLRLLEAFHDYRRSGGKWRLLLLGDGPQYQELTSKISQWGLDDFVRLTGWVQYEDLPAYYGLANALILPSISEPWGLVVNEAMASALPVLVSRKAGCVPELCWRGVNGFDFDPYSVDEMALTMLRTSDLASEELGRMGKASSEIATNFTPDTWAYSMVDCLNSLRKRER